MPGGDRTGPLGLGPATGRGAGYCRGNAGVGFADRGSAGFGRGGNGRRWRNQFCATGFWGPGRGWGLRAAGAGRRFFDPTGGAPDQERRQLELEAEFLRSELDAISRRLAEFKTDKET